MTLQRHGSQLGQLDSILRTRGPFSIQVLSSEASQMALQVSRNLLQYLGADSQILDSNAKVSSLHGNVISLAIKDFPKKAPHFDAITLDNTEGLVMCKTNGQRRTYEMEEGLGAIFLRPLEKERLELIIWGYDDQGLRQAARLVPMLTGVGQPDFIIVSKRCAWNGAAGVHAVGLFDNFWKVSEASFVS